jgi:hypothetical protein
MTRRSDHPDPHPMRAWLVSVVPPIRPIRTSPGRRSEDVMLILFIYLFPLLRKALDRAEHSRRDAYLASANDISELERRMQAIDIDR